MIGGDLHVHTTFCDGLADPETMVKAAIERGIARLGLLVHSYTFFDESYCVQKGREGVFQQEVAALKEIYRGQIELYCGVEQDYYSAASVSGFDYVIGSVHYLRRGDDYLPIDNSREDTVSIVRDYYDGDWYSYAEDYFRTVADVAEKIKPDIIGHFDLVAKYNGDGELFDESHPRYVAAWQAAADRLLAHCIPFEINLGGMLRSGRREPYPTLSIQRYLAAHGARVLLSGDCHAADALGVDFKRWEQAAKDVGFQPEQWAALCF